VKTLPVAVLLLAAAASAGAQTPAPPEHRYEITIVGGASLLHVEAESAVPLPVGLPELEPFLPPGALSLLPATIRRRDRLGASVLQGFQVSRRLARRGWLEASFFVAPHHTLRHDASFACPAEVCALVGLPSLAGVGDRLSSEERVTAYHYGLGFAYELARGDVRPFLSVGAGGVSYDAPRGGATDFAFEVGLGARLALGERVGARLEVADRIVLDQFLSHDTAHDVQLRVGLGVRLP